MEIRDGVIRLGQFLKLAGLVDGGGEAKDALGQGWVTVNGDVEERRGRQIHPGDVVTLDDEVVRVVGQHAESEG